MTTTIEKNLAQKMSEFEMSPRTKNALFNARIDTIGVLVQKSRADLLRLPNFGRKSLKEVETLLTTMGLHLGMEPQNGPAVSGDAPTGETSSNVFGALSDIFQHNEVSAPNGKVFAAYIVAFEFMLDHQTPTREEAANLLDSFAGFCARSRYPLAKVIPTIEKILATKK